MRTLLVQARHRHNLAEFTRLIGLASQNSVDLIVLPEDYIRDESFLQLLLPLMRSYHGAVATGLLCTGPLERHAIVLGNSGDVVLRRPKTPRAHNVLYQPSHADTAVGRIGILLCREIFSDGIELEHPVRVIANPIGVGMYSATQFDEWSERAQRLAETLQTPVVGVSHADGSFHGDGRSIPIAFAYRSDGVPVLLRSGRGDPVICDVQ